MIANVVNFWTLIPLAYIGFVLLRMKPVRRAIDEDFRTPRLGHVPSPIATLMLTRMLPSMMFTGLGAVALFAFCLDIPLRPEAMLGLWLMLIAGPLAFGDFISLQSRYHANWHGSRRRPKRFAWRQDA